MCIRDRETEDSAVAELIVQREEEENLQREAEERLEAEQAESAAEDARLRELYPLPEDDEYGDERYDEETLSESDQTENLKQEELLSKKEKTR